MGNDPENEFFPLGGHTPWPGFRRRVLTHSGLRTGACSQGPARGATWQSRLAKCAEAGSQPVGKHPRRAYRELEEETGVQTSRAAHDLLRLFELGKPPDWASLIVICRLTWVADPR